MGWITVCAKLCFICKKTREIRKKSTMEKMRYMYICKIDSDEYFMVAKTKDLKSIMFDKNR